MPMKAIQINTKDNVATATNIIKEGEKVEVLNPNGEVILVTEPLEMIPFGHKLALTKVNTGDKIVKYGEVIGIASKPIKLGEWIHTHNVVSAEMNTSGKNIKGVVS